MKEIYIIAEAGVNHNGSLEMAKQLVNKAAEARADAIKFQSFTAENIVCRNVEKAAYQKETTGKKETQLEMLKKLELSKEEQLVLMEHCKKQNITFLSTPFDLESIRFLDQMGVSAYKIPSGEITNYPYLAEIGKKNKPVLLSTGMSTIEEIKAAVAILREKGTHDITLLHCNTQYPTPVEDVNLRAMETMSKELGLPVGYSDHTKGIEVSIAAAAMGARVIEKHFTLDKHLTGPDHKASLEPDELKQMVSAIRNVERAMGNGKKEPSPSEKDNMKIARKSIVAACNIKVGEAFTEENLTTKRPGTGLTPMNWQTLIGKLSTREYERDELIQ